MISSKMPTLEYLTRPIIVNGKEISTEELAIFGRMCFARLAECKSIDRNFAKEFLEERILIYTNPENVDFD